MRFLKLEAVKSITGLSRSSIYQAIAEKKFPPQVKLGARSVAWVSSEIDEWVSYRISTRRNL